MANKIQIKRGTNLSNAGTPAAGELIYKSDTNELFVGDGSTAASSLTAINASATSVTLGGHTMNDVDIGSEFNDVDDHLMTSGAIKEKIESYGYSTGAGTVDTSGSPVDNDFAKFTDANTLEGRSYAEVRSDLGLGDLATLDDIPANKVSSGELATARVNWDSTDKTVRWDNGRGYHGNPRSMAIGYSGGNYGQFGYNIDFTTTSGQHTAAFTDIATRIDLHDGIRLYSSVSNATGGATISWTEYLRVQNTVFQYKGTNIATISNGSSNRVVTANNATNLNGESNLTYNGSTLQLSNSGNIEIGSGGANTAYIDLISDSTYTDYGARFIRWGSGANSMTDLVHRGTGDLRFVTSDAANILWLTGGAEKMRLVHSNGRLGLGTNSPAYDLHVDGHAYASSSFLGPNGSAGTPAYRFHNDGNSGMFLLAGDQVALSSGGYYITLQGSNELNYYNSGGSAAALYINHHASNSEVNIANSGAEIGQTYGVRVPDGSAGTPTHSFTGDTNTGMYRIGDDALGFSVGGNLAYQITASHQHRFYESDATTNYLEIIPYDDYIYFHHSAGNYFGFQTDHGRLDIGAQNSSHCHYSTDRANHWFNQMIYVNGGIVSSYNSDLQLRRNGSSADRIDVADSYTRIICDNGEKFRVSSDGRVNYNGWTGVDHITVRSQGHTNSASSATFYIKFCTVVVDNSPAHYNGVSLSGKIYRGDNGHGNWIDWSVWFNNGLDSAQIAHGGFMRSNGVHWISNIFVQRTGGDGEVDNGSCTYELYYDLNENWTNNIYNVATEVHYTSENKFNVTWNHDQSEVTSLPGTEVVNMQTNYYDDGNQTLVQSGAASAPSYSFLAARNTGMLLSGTNTIGFSTNGSTRFTMDDTGILYVSNKVQAGSAGIEIWDSAHGFRPVLLKDSTYTKLLNNDGTVMLYLGDSGDGNIYYNSGQHIFRNLAGSAEYLRITSGHISNTSGGDFHLRRDTTDDDMIEINASDTRIYGDADERIRIGSTITAYKPFSFNNTQTWNGHITWNNGKNVYVGGESSFDVSGSGVFQIWDSGTGAPFIKCDVGQRVEIGQAGSRGLKVHGDFDPTGTHYVRHGGSDYSPNISFLGGSDTPGSNAYENAGIGYYDNSGTGTMLFFGNRGAMNWTWKDDGDTLFHMASGGTFHANADVVAYSSTTSSDKRLKENINPIPYGLEEVLKMNPVEYDWKEKRNKAHDIGVIAQELEKIIPEVVQENKDLNSDKMIKGVDYGKMVAVLIKAIQEQQEEIELLKANYDDLKYNRR